jgi:hypothetical protein
MTTKKPRIVFLNKYSPNGASSRMRSYQFEAYFKELFEVEYLPLFTEAYIQKKYSNRSTLIEILFSYLRRFFHLLKLPSADIVWIEKESFPYLPLLFESIVFRLSRKVIVDYDDAIFHNYDDHRTEFIRKILGTKIDRVMNSANLVVAGNQYIQQRAQLAGAKKVVIAPTVIPSKRYPEIKEEIVNLIPIIGWIGTPMTQKFLLEIESVLDEIFDIRPFQLNLIGITETFWQEKKYRNRIIWSEASEASELAKIDIGIMPLTNNKFEQGKCGFKLIQYMGCSKPVLASPVGVNTSIVNEGINGFLCYNNEDWKKKLIILLDSKDLRKSLGKNGRRDYLDKFTQEAWGPILANLANDVLRN